MTLVSASVASPPTSSLVATLPTAIPPASLGDKPSSQFDPGLRVLIIDDMRTNRMLLRRAFTKFFGEKWLVDEREQASQALEAVQASRLAGRPYVHTSCFTINYH